MDRLANRSEYGTTTGSTIVVVEKGGQAEHLQGQKGRSDAYDHGISGGEGAQDQGGTAKSDPRRNDGRGEENDGDEDAATIDWCRRMIKVMQKTKKQGEELMTQATIPSWATHRRA